MMLLIKQVSGYKILKLTKISMNHHQITWHKLKIAVLLL